MTTIRSPDENPKWETVRAIDKAVRYAEYITALETEIQRVKAEQQLELMLAQKNKEETDEYKVVVRFAGGTATKPDLGMFEAEYPEKYQEFVDAKLAEYKTKIRITKDDLDAIFPVIDANGQPMEKSRTKEYYEARDARDERIKAILVEYKVEPQCSLYKKAVKQ